MKAVSRRLELLAEQHLTVSGAILALGVAVRAIIIEVLVATKLDGAEAV
jgi:hypothetical protein